MDFSWDRNYYLGWVNFELSHYSVFFGFSGNFSWYYVIVSNPKMVFTFEQLNAKMNESYGTRQFISSNLGIMDGLKKGFDVIINARLFTKNTGRCNFFNLYNVWLVLNALTRNKIVSFLLNWCFWITQSE